MKMFRSKRGFTLLELLMVIIVVGILASLAIPQYQNFAERARVTEAVNIISAIKSAQALYALENNGTWGATIDDLSDYITADNTATWSFSMSGNNIVATRLGTGTDAGKTIEWTLGSPGEWEDTTTADHPNQPTN